MHGRPQSLTWRTPPFLPELCRLAAARGAPDRRPLSAARPQVPRDESPGVERSPANAVVALQRTAGNRATARAIAVLQRQPTFGNLFPDDAPIPDAEVVRLEKVDGKWREIGSQVQSHRPWRRTTSWSEIVAYGRSKRNARWARLVTPKRRRATA